jgi:hypothetical protein
MTNRLFLALSALVLVAGCDKPADATVKSASPVTSARPAAAPPSAEPAKQAPAKPALEETKNDAMGYKIKLPKGTKTNMSDANGGTYGFDTMVIMVGPTGVALKTSDDLLRAVNTTDGAIEKKTMGDALVAIVTKPNSPVHVYAGPKGKKISATCMAEPSQKDLAIEVCTSLVATK